MSGQDEPVAAERAHCRMSDAGSSEVWGTTVPQPEPHQALARAFHLSAS